MGAVHNLALAFDEYLRLTNPEHETRRQIEAYLGNHDEPGLHPALSALQRLRFEAEREVERLLALMDAIDGDPDLEISAEVDGDFACDENGFEPNLATTESEDATGAYAEPPIPCVMGLDQAPDELEDACEDEGAQCEDEGVDTDTEAVDEDGDILDQGEGGDDGFYSAHREHRRRMRKRRERIVPAGDLPILRYAGGDRLPPQQ